MNLKISDSCSCNGLIYASPLRPICYNQLFYIQIYDPIKMSNEWHSSQHSTKYHNQPFFYMNSQLLENYCIWHGAPEKIPSHRQRYCNIPIKIGLMLYTSSMQYYEFVIHKVTNLQSAHARRIPSKLWTLLLSGGLNRRQFICKDLCLKHFGDYTANQNCQTLIRCPSQS